MPRRFEKAKGRETWRPAWRRDKFILMSNRYKLLAEFRGLQTPKAIQDIFARAPLPGNLPFDKYTQLVSDTLTWPEVDLVEQAVIGLIPETDLAEQLKTTRVVYRRTVNESEYRDFALSMADVAAVATSTGPSYIRIRSELLAITQRIKYVLEQEPPKEHARALLTTYNTGLIVGAGVQMLLFFVPRLVLRQESIGRLSRFCSSYLLVFSAVL